MDFPNQSKRTETFKKWRDSQFTKRREDFADLLKELEDARDIVDDESGYSAPNPNEAEVIKWHRWNKQWEWAVERRMRELIRWERDDLEWEWKLSRREFIAERYGHKDSTNEAEETPPTKRPVRLNTKPNRQHRKRSPRAK